MMPVCLGFDGSCGDDDDSSFLQKGLLHEPPDEELLAEEAPDAELPAEGPAAERPDGLQHSGEAAATSPSQGAGDEAAEARRLEHGLVSEGQRSGGADVGRSATLAGPLSRP